MVKVVVMDLDSANEASRIYMDHEPEQELVTPQDKCKDILYNVILTDENIRNSTMVDEVRSQVYHVNGWQSDEEEQEQVKNKIVARCGKRNEKNIKSLKATHIGTHYISEIENKPKVKLKEMITDIKQRLKKWAKELTEGKLTEHYARIWDYAQDLLIPNPRSTCNVCVTFNPDGKKYFHMFYIVKDEKEGVEEALVWMGMVKGELLTSIGRDANNQVYLIVSVVMYVDNKPNWTWFLELLRDDLKLDGGRGLVVISDQHKSTRSCFWDASMSCMEGDFKMHMERIKSLNFSVYEYSMSKQPKTWCRAFLYQSMLVKKLRMGSQIYVMDSVEENESIWTEYEVPLSILTLIIIITMIVTNYITDCMFWLIIHSQGHVYEARRGSDGYRVELDALTCSCRFLDLSRIPCVHANAAINFIQLLDELEAPNSLSRNHNGRGGFGSKSLTLGNWTSQERVLPDLGSLRVVKA
uniref:SWIM-type domain-containing protein n=1 Tax=Lactuca sativa TaxID=4236 RepID=A0A9R1WGA4_LACSA|nr:hypothetical protein LSAT_V11C200071050 [Lactuca sativa]